MLLTCSVASAKVYLVSVGISEYQKHGMNLALPVSDAKTITWLYTKNTDVVYRQLLNSFATSEGIIDAMDKVFSLASEDDMIVLYFSGHGYQGGFMSYDGKLSFTSIRDCMSKSKCKAKIIFADACFAGTIRPDKTNHSSPEISSAKKSDVILFMSCRSDESSFESHSMKNGYFTTYLQKGLRGGADTNKDRIITAKELFTYVNSNVVTMSKGVQHPVMWGSFSDNMVIMKW